MKTFMYISSYDTQRRSLTHMKVIMAILLPPNGGRMDLDETLLLCQRQKDADIIFLDVFDEWVISCLIRLSFNSFKTFHI